MSTNKFWNFMQRTFNCDTIINAIPWLIVGFFVFLWCLLFGPGFIAVGK